MSYFWLFFSSFVILFAFLGDDSITKNRIISRFSRIGLLISLSIVLSLCGSPYVDHESYRDFFYHIEKLDFGGKNFIDFFIGKSEGSLSPIENGFYLLTTLIYKVGFSHIGYFFALGFITNYFVIKVYYKFKYPVIAFLLYLTSNYFFQEFNLVRQMLAVSILIYSISFIEEKRWKQYVLFLLIAFLIHQSAVIGFLFLPFCFIDNVGSVWKLVKWALMPLYLMSLLVALKIVSLDLSIFVLMDLYEGYLTNEAAAGIEKVNINWIYNFLIVLCLFFYKGEPSKYIYALFFISAHNLGRIALNFAFLYPAFAPDMLGSRSLFRNRMVNLSFLALLTAYHARILIVTIITGNHLVGTKVEDLFFFR